MKKIRFFRHTAQAVFLVLVFLRLHRQVAPILAIFLPLAFVCGNFFCGWLCPLGAIQEFFGRIGVFFVKKKLTLPHRIQHRARYARYLLALVLLALVGIGIMGADDANALSIDAYQSFLAIFDGHPLALAATAFLAFVLFLSLFTDRPYCNYLCVNGIEYALPSFTRIFTIKRHAHSCIACKACDRRCPMHIEVSGAAEVRNLQCINCFTCLEACPVNGVLGYGRADETLAKLWKAIGRPR